MNAAALTLHRRGRLRRPLRLGSSVGIVVIGTFILMAILAAFLAPYDPRDLVGRPFMPPLSPGHFLGTDDLGRDVMSRLLFGARVSLLVGVLVAVLSTVVGVLIGAFAGYSGGRIDSILMRTTDAFQTVPPFLVALVVVAMLGPHLTNVILVLGLLTWPRTARVVRGQFLTLRTREFVAAARGIGANTLTLVFREILPNALPPTVAVASLEVGRAIMLEASLSFLGLGDPSVISWGSALQSANAFLHVAWWMSIFPGIALFAVVMAFSALSDGLSSYLNPKLRTRKVDN